METFPKIISIVLRLFQKIEMVKKKYYSPKGFKNPNISFEIDIFKMLSYSFIFQSQGLESIPFGLVEYSQFDA